MRRAVMQQALNALELGRDYAEGERLENERRYKGHEHLAPDDAYAVGQIDAAIATLRAALAEQSSDSPAPVGLPAGEQTGPVAGGSTRAEQAQPVAYTGWRSISEPYEPTDELDIMLGDGSILCAVLPQFDGDLWWGGDGTGEKFIDPKYANVTHWRLHAAAPETPAPVAPQPLTIERLRDALVASRVIPPEAVEDADNYDDGAMLGRIEALHRRIA